MNLKQNNTINGKNYKWKIDSTDNNNYTSYHTSTYELVRHNSDNKSNNDNAKTLTTNIATPSKWWKKHIFSNNSDYHEYIINNFPIKNFARVVRNNDNSKNISSYL